MEHLSNVHGLPPWSLRIRNISIPNTSSTACSTATGGTEPITTPEMDVVSLYVDQQGEGDLFQERADRHPGMKICPTIEEALTLGTGKLAVDGVVVVAEHGVYPLSENGIMMRPHYEFFEQITKVFRASGRSVPYFNDKELSWNWDWSKKMVDVSHELNFPLQGGSSLAVTWRIPSVEFPLGATLRRKPSPSAMAA